MDNIAYPHVDEYMTYNYNDHRYILTAQGVKDRLAIDLTKEFKDNIASSINAFLNQVSLQVYNMIHNHSIYNLFQDFIIAKTETGRRIIQQAMEQRVLYLLTREKMYDESLESVLLTVIPEIGVTICYAGRFPTFHADSSEW